MADTGDLKSSAEKREGSNPSTPTMFFGGRSCFKSLHQKAIRLLHITETMNLPECRRRDLLWLNRNIGIDNKDHQDFDEAVSILKQLLKAGVKSI